MKTLPIKPDALVDFIQTKITEMEQTLKCREDMEKDWRGGTDAGWHKAGCLLSRKWRLEYSATHARIAAKNRIELHMLKAVLERLKETAP